MERELKRCGLYKDYSGEINAMIDVIRGNEIVRQIEHMNKLFGRKIDLGCIIIDEPIPNNSTKEKQSRFDKLKQYVKRKRIELLICSLLIITDCVIYLLTKGN